MVPIVTIVNPVRRSVLDVMLYWGLVEFVGEVELEGLGEEIFLSFGGKGEVVFEEFIGLDGRGAVGTTGGFDETLLGGTSTTGMNTGLLIFRHFFRSRFKMNPSRHSIQSFESLLHFVQESFFKK